MPDGIIYYTDGSARPNPGNAGWGVHGYYYKEEKPKKGAGVKTHILTSNGYRAKLDAGAKELEVTPINYIDSIGSLIAPSTNNVAEMRAAVEALKDSLKYDAKKVSIYSDSKMVVEGSNKWIYNWKNNGWVKKDGSQLSSLDLWKSIYDLKEQLKNKDVEVSFDWVMGHGDNPGNNQADKLAVIGTMRSKRDSYVVQTDKVAPEGYWSKPSIRHPLIDHGALYFNTLSGYNVKGQYYLGNKYKEEDQLGAPTADTAYSIVKLKQPEWVLEFIRDEQTKICDNGKRDLLVVSRVDTLYKNDIYADIEKYGLDVLIKGKNRWDLFYFQNNDPITRILVPPKLAQRAVEELTVLYYKLEQYEEKSTELIYNDITALFYDTIDVTKKKETVRENKLSDRIQSSIPNIDVNVKCLKDGKEVETSLTLIFGCDILSRNALKKIEGQNPKITLITWTESDSMIRYATVVETDDGISITSSVYSDMKILK